MTAAVAEVMEASMSNNPSPGGPDPATSAGVNSSNPKSGAGGTKGTGRKKKSSSFRNGERARPSGRGRPEEGDEKGLGEEKNSDEVNERLSPNDHDLPEEGRPPARSGGRPTRRSSRKRTGSKPSAGKSHSGTGVDERGSNTLENELEQEMRYRDTIRWSVGVLQQSVDDLEKQLDEIENGGGSDEEFKLRYDAQVELNAKLEEQTKWYKDELESSRERMNKGQEFAYDQGLDDYTEFELAHMVKLLERERNGLYGELRNKSWLLDNQSKEYYHLKELIKAYSGDLTIVNRSLEKIWRQQQHNYGLAGGSTPVLSPGSLRWISETGINPSQRIIDPRKGPIRKTVGVRSLPRLDGEALDELEASAKGWRYGMSRSRSRGRRKTRAKSLDAKKRGKSSHLESSAQTPKSEEPNTISDGFVRVTSTSKNFDKSDGFIRFHSGGSVENFVKKDDVVEGEAQPQVESNSWMEGGSKRDSGVATMEKGRPRRSEDPKTTVRMTRRPREDPPMLFRRDPRGETKKALRGETKRPSKGETTGPTRGETRRALGGRNRAGSTSKSRQGSKERKVEREGAEERDQFAQSVNEALLRSNLEFTQSRSGDEDVEGNDGGLAPNRGNEDRSFLSVGHHEESSEVRNKGSSAEDPDHGFSESQESPDSGLRDGGSGGDLEGEDTRTKGTGSDGGASDDGFADDDDARGGNEEVFGGASMTKLPETFAEETAKERSDLLLPEGKVVPPEDYHNEPRSSGDSQRSSSGVFDDFEASTTASIELNSEDMAMETLEPNKV
ncbi:uncharacterized protein LOC143028335 isoform X2 [Oratosquilla oratoria]|uniref:uncharacterized protein LOC143028335 isoform X2 n=1 Tax=Oratosquilla oratoria TaxID=337810 RepID=UPI003F757521